MSNIIKKALILLVSFVLLLSLAAPLGLAQGIVSENQYEFDDSFTQEQINEMKTILKDSALDKEVQNGISLQPYVDASGDLINFNYKKAIEDGLPISLVERAKKEYEKANKYLEKNLAKTSARATCGGKNKFEGNLVAGTLYIDSCKTQKIIGIITIGGSISTLVALLPGGAAIATVATCIYGIGIGVLTYNNAKGKGVKVKVLKNPITKKLYPYWVKSQ